MLGSRYDDQKERLENRRASFFLTAAEIEAARSGIKRYRSTGSSAVGTRANNSSVSGIQRQPISKTRSLNSVVSNDATTNAFFNPNNPQDDYGSTRRESFSSENERALLMSSNKRSQSMIHFPRTSCADLSNIDEKPLLDVVDRIEDQVENHAYEDLVPIEVKMAVENRIFGWSHLTSSILGHIFYTLGSFALVYFILSQIHDLYHMHKKHGDPYAYMEDDEWWFRVLRAAAAGFSALSTYRMVRRRRHVWLRAPYGSKEYQQDADRRRLTVRETDQNTLLGRLMRRRHLMMQKRVQKRLVKAHRMFQQRQLRQQEKLREEQEKLQQQQNAIPEKEVFDVNGEPAGNTEQEALCSPRSMCYSPCDSFCGGEYDVADELEPSQADHSQSDSTPSTSDDEDTVETFMALNDLSEELNPESNAALQERRKRRRTFHTKPTSKMESIMHDQVLFRHKQILNMPYAHGGFFGAAPFMLASPHWISILRHLMPDVYVEISRRVAYAPASKLIHWAENNPVVAAFGVAHDLERGSHAPPNVHTEEKILRTTPNLEWDVFLDPYLVDDVEVVLQERDKFLSSILPMEHYSFYESHKPLGLSLEDWLDNINKAAVDDDDVGARIELTESQRQILQYYADQLESRAQELVDKMLIAHGKLTHLIFEILGLAKRYNYSRVKRTRRTLGGGIYARQWMAVFAEALRFGLFDDDEAISSLSNTEGVRASIKNVDSFMSTSLDALANAKCPDSSITESVSLIRSILRRHCDDTIDTEYPVGLVLDIKSRRVSKRVWACVVDTLRASGVRVVGVASFTVDEIRGISKFCSDPLMEVIFFHSAGDLQRACHEGKIRYGDKVFFNCGSLLWDGTQSLASTATHLCGLGFDPEQIKKNYRILPFGRTRKMYDAERGSVSSSPTGSRLSTISDSSAWMDGSTVELYKERYGLSVGLYAQEFAIDDTAANLIVELVNENPEVYDLGLSWGGVNGITIRGIQPGRFTSTDGLWNQRYIGTLWQSDLFPPPISSPIGTPPQTPTNRTELKKQ